jgi:hypothetical protein
VLWSEHPLYYRFLRTSPANRSIKVNRAKQ